MSTEAVIHRGSENGNRFSPTGREVLTGVTRQLIDVTAPRPEQIDIRDIARSLARQERFTGHCPLRPSVAAHSLAAEYIARCLMPHDLRFQLPDTSAENGACCAVLMHDSAEFLVSDLNGAVKKEIRPQRTLWARDWNTRRRFVRVFNIGRSRFDELEDLADAAIVERYCCSPAGFEALVHEADILACAYEMAHGGWCPEAKPPEWMLDDRTLRNIYLRGDLDTESRFVERATELGMT